jgi:hypothetical protein
MIIFPANQRSMATNGQTVTRKPAPNRKSTIIRNHLYRSRKRRPDRGAFWPMVVFYLTAGIMLLLLLGGL